MTDYADDDAPLNDHPWVVVGRFLGDHWCIEVDDDGDARARGAHALAFSTYEAAREYARGLARDESAALSFIDEHLGRPPTEPAPIYEYGVIFLTGNVAVVTP